MLNLQTINYHIFTLIILTIIIININYSYSFNPINYSISQDPINILFDNVNLCNNNSKYCQNDTHIFLNYTNAYIEINYTNLSYLKSFYFNNFTFIKKEFSKAKIYVLKDNYINHSFYIYNDNFKTINKISSNCIIHNTSNDLCNILNNFINKNKSNLNLRFPFKITFNINNSNFKNITSNANISINYNKFNNLNNKISFYPYDKISYNNQIINFDFSPYFILDQIQKPIYYGENYTINNNFISRYNFTINEMNISFLNLKLANYSNLISKRNKIIIENLDNTDIKEELKSMINYFIESK